MILVTGASGFIGNALVDYLQKSNHAQNIVVALRANAKSAWTSRVIIRQIDNIGPHTDWTQALEQISTVIHCAARVHIMKDTANNHLSDYRLVNVQGTLNLAKQAAAKGVRRFIFLSSIKVNGDFTGYGKKFKADDSPAPVDAYGISKMEAEQGLQEISKKTGMEFVIIRPPLVYGPNAKGNFLSMVKWVNRRIPLLLGSIDNKRSFVSIDNLVNLISVCISNPSATNQIFLVSDGEDMSTANLIHRLGLALNKKTHLILIPVRLFKLTFFIIGKKHVAHRICSSLEVDIQKTHEILKWWPPVSVDEGLKNVVKNLRYGL